MARSVTIPASMRRALAEIKAGPRNREAHLGAILCPKPISLDEWESYARPQQAALMQASTDDHVAARLGPAEAVSDGPLLSTAIRAKEAPTWIRS